MPQSFLFLPFIIINIIVFIVNIIITRQTAEFKFLRYKVFFPTWFTWFSPFTQIIGTNDFLYNTWKKSDAINHSEGSPYPGIKRLSTE